MRRSGPIAVTLVVLAAAGQEYRVLDLKAVKDAGGSGRGGHAGLADGLNALAGDGWELVAIDPERREGGTTKGTSGPVTWSAQFPAGYVFMRAK